MNMNPNGKSRLRIHHINICAAFALLTIPARADSVITTGSIPQLSVATAIAGADASLNGQPISYISVACSFSPTISGNLSSVQLPVEQNTSASGASNNFTVSLDGDNGGNGPLTTEVLAFGTLTATTPEGSGDLTTFNYTGASLTLSAGVTYWIVVSPADSNTFVLWDGTLGGTPTTYYSNDDGFTYVPESTNVACAFQVNASPVPEPSTWAFMLVAGSLLVITRKKRTILYTASVKSLFE